MTLIALSRSMAGGLILSFLLLSAVGTTSWVRIVAVQESWAAYDLGAAAKGDALSNMRSALELIFGSTVKPTAETASGDVAGLIKRARANADVYAFAAELNNTEASALSSIRAGIDNIEQSWNRSPGVVPPVGLRQSLAVLDNELSLQRNQLLAANSSTITLTRTLLETAGLGALGLLAMVGIALLFLTRTRVINPITTLASAIGELGRQSPGPMPYADRDDEIGKLAQALEQFRAAQNDLRVARTEEEQAIQRDLERTAALEGAMHGFEAEAGQITATLRGNSYAMANQADRLIGAVDTTRSQLTAMADESVRAGAQAEAVDAAATNLARSAELVGRRSSEARHAISSAIADSRSMTEKISALSLHMTTIDQVVQIISAVAAKTNLLALNATIEAARAGEAGKGFSIVAGEVKSLAKQTADATQQIETRIKEIRFAAGSLGEAVETVSTGLEVVAQGESEVAEAVQGQVLATDEIREVARKIHLLMEEIAQSASAVGREAEATQAVAEQIRLTSAGTVAQVDALGQASEALKRVVARDHPSS